MNTALNYTIIGNNYLLFKNDVLHSFNDEPAIIFADGTKCWYDNGLLHRGNDKPAIIYQNTTLEWYRYGKLHRDSELGTLLPSVIYSNGIKDYYQNGIQL